ncbi:MAG: hypothetical protein GOMPHAMPRED_002128 [Gomphillus americanus]|uniref:Peroxisomal targeting signal receptor n=1 Tax=Gomphillus americanus TaxID=1940652 RepID=A0A8H3IJ64_9LECA|nr:MAG: hypothetical protein GOMPHAMPRED_002128 [Gomphillus americanus]
MSFLSGPECSTGANPLAQFAKHTQDDKSLQRDRLAGRGSGGAFEGMRSQGLMGQNDKMMDTFLQQPTLPQTNATMPFAMDQIRRELDSVGMDRSRTGSPMWATEFTPASQISTAPLLNGAQNVGLNSREFAAFQQVNRSTMTRSPPQISSFTQQTFQPRFYGGSGFSVIGNGMQMPMMSMQQPISAESKGKGKMVELDDTNWEQQFAEMDAVEHDVEAQQDAAIERELDELDRSVVTDSLDGYFESLWSGIVAEQVESRDLEIPAFNDELNPWGEFDNFGSAFRDPQLGDYLFEEDNVYRQVDDPFQEGVKIMQEAGNLSLAALAFEAAVQKNPEHIEAWVMLGTAQAQNEKETPAIRALEQALRLNPSNLEALMGLAVSYTNEGYDATAYRTLEQWLSMKYPQIIGPDQLSSPNDIGFTDRQALHDKVTSLYIKAAQLSPDGDHMDPDVQVGLGVLFYGAEEYDKAVDCFSAALASTESGTTNQRSQIHLLWNRLGATLANSGRSEDAITAYERALTFNANFVRARYNLGVSCINIGCYDEAAQHLLGALSMHAVVQQQGRERVERVAAENGVDEEQIDRMMSMNQSTNLYETLRRVFMQMGRRDLADKVVPGVDVGVFRNEFEF